MTIFRADLYACKRGMDFSFVGWTHPTVKWDNFQLNGERFDPSKHDSTTCQICIVAKWTPIGKAKISPTAKPRVVPKGEIHPTPPKTVYEKKICIKCKQKTGKGIPHHCTQKSFKKNLATLIGEESVTSQEQVLGESLKSLVTEKGGEPGEEVRLTGLRGGNPLSVTVGKPSEVPSLLTSGFMAGIQKKLHCGEAKLLSLARSFKKEGIKFEPHIREELLKLSHSLDHFYTVEKVKVTRTEKVNKKYVESEVERDLVFLKDPASFIEHVIQERGLNRDKVMVRIGLDGGQGSFKVVVSVFETDYDPEISFSTKEGPGNMLTGANRLLVMAIAEDIQELYNNLRLVVEKLQLDKIDFCMAADLKLINAYSGISSHSGKFACPYCEGEMTLQLARLRTFGNLAERFAEYEAAGSKKKDMMKFKNVIHKCLMKGDPDTTILSAIPLPELHLLMGLVNWGLEVLYKVVPKDELLAKMRHKGISIHGYHGGGLDEGNFNLFLKHLDYLAEGTPVKASPVFEMLQKFQVVKKSCFSKDLATSYSKDIDDFNISVQRLLNYAEKELNIKLQPTWKIHILVVHLKAFLDEKKVGLGIYCEQTSEAAHAAMKPTIDRFKRKADHPLHGPRLLRAASCFSGQNM
jgi:hypothetical protein